jgi:hypothetical protein
MTRDKKAGKPAKDMPCPRLRRDTPTKMPGRLATVLSNVAFAGTCRMREFVRAAILTQVREDGLSTKRLRAA